MPTPNAWVEERRADRLQMQLDAEMGVDNSQLPKGWEYRPELGCWYKDIIVTGTLIQGYDMEMSLRTG